MAKTLKASEPGLDLVYIAIRRKGWTKTQTSRWWKDANSSQATLRRFWRGIGIDYYTFQQICEVAGVDWKSVAEEPYKYQYAERRTTPSAATRKRQSSPLPQLEELENDSLARLSHTWRILSLMLLLECDRPDSYPSMSKLA
ncbi:hypothetical protein [Roseofilum casamattae]|uniref:XRE family transcriptional regulator n=1 Tax=Roseofilum casamattae BLCC-M143 TaxID=3022442 RepID=A0ABT7BWN7_9CYAN|nr:hypothetical protein [Roseofilum casamattae]MDJ1183614.1 hypothetical protein [Roseofilum casamattae BLCC-M143]